MQHDDIIWDVIRRGNCSFRKKTVTEQFCSSKFNILGVCAKQYCPLANSRYATVLEEHGQCYLYIKTIERAHTPNKLWEKIKLPPNYLKAIAEINKQLAYWPKRIVQKNKLRLTRIHQYLIRMRRLRTAVKPELVPYIRSRERLEEKREKKAHTAAHIQDSIKTELLSRLRDGVYGELYDDIVNFPQKEFMEALDELDDIQELAEEESDTEFVEAYDDEEEAEYEFESEQEAPVKRSIKSQVSNSNDDDDDFNFGDENLDLEDFDFNQAEEEEEEEVQEKVVKKAKTSNFAEKARSRKTTTKKSKRGSIEIEE